MGVGSQFNLRNLCWSYVPGRLILDKITLSIGAGEWVALAGPNGCGKSTLLRLAGGLLNPSGGQLTGSLKFKGKPIEEIPPHLLARQLAFVPADLQTQFDLSLNEYVMLGRLPHANRLLSAFSQKDRDFSASILSEMDLTGWAEVSYRELSGGYRQMANIARGLAQNPEVLILDESLSMMDPGHQKQVAELLDKRVKSGLTVIWVSHDLNLSGEWSSRMILVSQGSVVADGLAREVLNKENLDRLYGSECCGIFYPNGATAPKVFIQRSLDAVQE